MGAASPPNPADALGDIHLAIDACRICEAFVGRTFRKPTQMERGDRGRIVIVGQNPGRQEVVTGRAFSGQAGRRLNDWLRQAAPRPETPRAGIYLTATVKCLGANGHYRRMLRNCRQFLFRQLAALHPSLVIALGRPAFETLRFSDDLDYRSQLCRLVRSRDHWVTPPFGVHFDLLPWPHPSGLNRDLNDSATTERLRASFEILASVLKEHEP
jgi:uracil-DNA glycosylase family 4